MGSAVDKKDFGAYADPSTRLFANDATAGGAVTPDGDLVSVFRHKKAEGAPIKEILTEAAAVFPDPGPDLESVRDPTKFWLP